MAGDVFSYDVFLSHSSKDKPIVRRLAQRLREDGLKVWFDEWAIPPGGNIPRLIDEGLEQSAVLVLCMSANSLGSDWAAVESQAFRFTDPVNRELRFIPLRLDDTEPRASLRQFAFVDWRGEGTDEAYTRLLDACRRQRGGSLFCNGLWPEAGCSRSALMADAQLQVLMMEPCACGILKARPRNAV